MNTATYSPDDNKLRLHTLARLDTETYNRAKSAGFRWAPKQKLFYATWSPRAEDFAIELAGEIDDENASLMDRAEERSERFEQYSDNRARDAEQAHAAVDAIAENIPLGQPILVGHHSEKRARRDAKRIENGMRKAIKAFETSEYWTYRAAAAIRHAEYKERPDVRARRIKKLEAARRKQQKNHDTAALLRGRWAEILTTDKVRKKNGGPTTAIERALHLTNFYDHLSFSFSLEKYPRDEPASQYEGPMSLWSALNDGVITAEQAQAIAVPSHTRSLEYALRWIEHLENRLAYEKAMLGDENAKLLEKPKRRKLPPIVNYPGEDFTHIKKAEYTKTHRDYKGCRETKNEHGPYRMRYMMGVGEDRHSYGPVYITDQKRVDPPGPTPPKPDKKDFDAMQKSLDAGVQTISAPQLFPTPAPIAEKMVALADIQPGNRVLEPSAGTGVLLGAMGGRMFDNSDTPYLERDQLHAVEISQPLADKLSQEFPLTKVKCGDFLRVNGELGKFDRIVMNPPFSNGADIEHINHARAMLAPEGVLVALCANGPRQQDKLMSIADSWEPLAPGSFKGAGTNVNTVLLSIKT